MSHHGIHDVPSQLGFDVSPEQLAHDLAIAKLSNDESLSFNHKIEDPTDEVVSELDIRYFEEYENWYHRFYNVIDDRTRYDSAK